MFLRLVLGVVFFYAGYVKWGMWSATPEGMSAGMALLMKFLSIVEPLGAVAVIIGFLTRWAAAGFSIIMVGAIVLLQFMMGISFSGATGAGWNFPLMVLAGSLVLMTFGPGSWSLEAKLKAKKAQVVV